MFYCPEDAEWAASLGLSFAIMPCRLDDIPDHIAARLKPDQCTVTLELGGGIVAYPEDVAVGVEAVLALLGQSGFLEPGDYDHERREPTPPELIYMYDARIFVRAPAEGAFYTQAQPGANFSREDPFGFWVPLDGLRPQPVLCPELCPESIEGLAEGLAPKAGKLVYLRTRNRVSQGETLAMFLPHQSNKKRSNGKCL
jgi:predicted deacylase